MSAIDLCLTTSFAAPKSGANFVVFCDPKNAVPGFASKGYLEECCRYAKKHRVYLVPWMFTVGPQLCLGLIDPEGQVIGASRAASLSMENAGQYQCYSDIRVAQTPFGQVYLSVDVDVYSPQIGRLAALKGAQLVVASQYLDPFTYSDDAVTQGAWNLAQSNDLWVVSATNMGGAVICPWDDRMASDGYVIRPNDFYPIGCHIDLEKFWQLHQRENILQGLNRGVLKKYKEFLMR